MVEYVKSRLRRCGVSGEFRDYVGCFVRRNSSRDNRDENR